MIYQLSGIMRDVRVCLDENMSNDNLLKTGDINTLSLDDIVRAKIPEAVRLVHMAAPTYLLENGHNFGDSIYWGELESGWVLLPDDFMRLIVFKMSDWERSVYTAISTDDPKYEKMRSRYKGIRGTYQKPSCAIAIRPEGRVLEFYSCKDNTAYVSMGIYLPYPQVDETDGIDISPKCYQSIIYMAAALTLTTYGETQKASEFSNLSKMLLQ